MPLSEAAPAALESGTPMPQVVCLLIFVLRHVEAKRYRLWM
jgi:hypothetical protein